MVHPTVYYISGQRGISYGVIHPYIPGTSMCMYQVCHVLPLQSDVGRFSVRSLRHSSRHAPEGSLVIMYEYTSRYNIDLV